MNHTFYYYLKLFLISLSGSFVLSTFSAFDPFTDTNIIEGQTSWFITTTALFAVSLLLSYLPSSGKEFRITLPNILLLLLLPALAWMGDLTQEKSICLGMLLCLWIMLRSTLKEFPDLRMLFLTVILCTGVTQMIWGGIHQYGLISPEHRMVKLATLYVDPVQLASYSIAVTPILFGMILKLHSCNKKAWWHIRTAIYYFSWICLVITILSLPAFMNLSGWLTIFIACGLVYYLYKVGWRKTTVRWSQLSVRSRWLASGILLILCTGIILLFCLDSTSGEPLHPLLQTPYYRMFFGLFLCWNISSMYMGIKNKRYSTVGGIAAFTIFTCWSVPFSFPSFWVLLLFLSAICVADPVRKVPAKIISDKKVPYLSLIAALTTIFLYFIY